jgi:hypothetical protein
MLGCGFNLFHYYYKFHFKIFLNPSPHFFFKFPFKYWKPQTIKKPSITATPLIKSLSPCCQGKYFEYRSDFSMKFFLYIFEQHTIEKASRVYKARDFAKKKNYPGVSIQHPTNDLFYKKIINCILLNAEWI